MTETSTVGYLENQLLVAMPQLGDPYFAHTVTYLWKHSEEGALGLIINKPLEARVTDIFEELDIVSSASANAFASQHILSGGPVERDKGFILHDSERQWESSISVASGISICTSKTILQDIAAGAGPKNYLIALGCAGWSAGQLEREIGENAWLTTPAPAELLFCTDFPAKAQKAAAQLGVDLQQLSPSAGHS